MDALDETDALDVALTALAVWRITHLLAAEDGPGGLLARLRRLAGQGFWGELLDCFYCSSVWIALPFALWLGRGWSEVLLLWPALSGAAVLLERATAERQTAVPYYVEEPIDGETR